MQTMFNYASSWLLTLWKLNIVSSNLMRLKTTGKECVFLETLPSAATVNLNIDTTLDLRQKKSAIEFSTRDSSGYVLGAYSNQIGFCSSLFGELLAVKYCLELAKMKGSPNIKVQLNSNLACEIINNRDSINNKRALIWAIRPLMDSYWKLQIHHICGEANCSAHWVARKGLSPSNRNLILLITSTVTCKIFCIQTWEVLNLMLLTLIKCTSALLHIAPYRDQSS